MRELRIRTSQGTYPVRTASGSVSELATQAHTVILDENVDYCMRDAVVTSRIVLSGSEDIKTIAGVEQLLGLMHEGGLRRGDRVAAVGGGTIQDVVTFAASVYMRGLPWTYAPSTAMSMLDSCLGGKSSINVGNVKNLVGNIYPPTEVVIDLSLAETLSAEAKIAGLAEAVKICFARGPRFFAEFRELATTAEEFANDEASAHLVAHTLSCKQWFIEIDEFDQKERQLLNFGHTFAHALEAAAGFRLSHGVAVAVGVLAAIRHPAAASTSESASLDAFCLRLLAPLRGALKSTAELLNWETFHRAFSADKKHSQSTLRLILPASSGAVEVREFSRSEGEIAKASSSLDRALKDVII